MNTPEKWKKELFDWNIGGIYHVDGGEYNVDEDRLVSFVSSTLQTKQKAVMDVLPKEKEFDRDIDGGYSFGKNQKTIGFNSCLSAVRTALNELFSKQI